MPDHSDLSDDDLLGEVRTLWERRDPVPAGLVARVQEAAALAASDTDLDIELMLLVERSEELAGTRGSGTDASAYTLRFAHAGVDLLVRVSTDGPASRVDGWVVPPAPIAVTAQRETDAGWADVATLEVGDAGRFELPALTPGMLRLRLEPNDGSTPFQTPAFEI